MLKLNEYVDNRHFVPVDEVEYIGREERDFFNQHGYCVLRNVIPKNRINALYRAAQQQLAEANNEYWVSAPERRNPLFHEYFLCNELGAIIRDLNGPSKMFLGFLLRKPARNPHVKPWHQDGVYWGGNGQRVCALFTPLTSFGADNGALRVIPGSHRLGRLYHWPEDDILLVCDTSALTESECVEAEPGDVVAVHSLTVHGSTANRSDHERVNLGSHWANNQLEFQLDESTIRLNESIGSMGTIEHS